MSDLTILLVQAEPVWENPPASLARLDALLPASRAEIDLIVLPEMFATGFSMNPAPLAETMDGPSVRWLRDRSAAMGAHLAGSLIVGAGGHYYNRLLWATPEGALWHYDKRHLFRMAGEERVYRAGERRLSVTCNGWRVRPFICYDLRFPVWTRNDTGQSPFDLALFVANWPSSRAAHWRALLRARAIENQCFVAGVNRVGLDGNGLDYQGDSMVFDPLGEPRLQIARQACAVPLTLYRAELEDCRRRFPFLEDADHYRLEGDLAGGDGEV